MKTTITILILLLCASGNAQIAVVPKIGSALPYNIRGFVGVELQASILSIEACWRPYKMDHNIYSDGFSLGTNLYWFPFQSTPYFAVKIITKGKYIIDDITGKSERTLSGILGYRLYPFKSRRCDFVNKFSMNGGAGIDAGNYKDKLGETKVKIRFAAELSVNFILFKFDDSITSHGPLSYHHF